ncbi:MAG: ABC transporter ATP-binding protein [Slackia sp.]|nr:ABC transporter ATP-binding protein [Slackia sp.]
MNEVALRVDGLKKQNGRFLLDIENFSVAFGSIVGLVGKNGAGKTTFLNIIAGRSRFDEGSLLFSDELRAGGNDEIACVFDQPDIDGLFCARDIDMVFRNLYQGWSSDEFFSYIDMFGIDCDKRIVDMSRGMKTKAMLSIGLSHDARLLLLDEVTSGIDPYTKNDMLRVIRSYVLEKNAAAVLSSHIMSDLDCAADFCAVLSLGSLVLFDSVAEIKEAAGSLSMEEYLVSLGRGCVCDDERLGS